MTETPGLRAYLGIRSAAPLSFSADGARVLVRSDLTGTTQLYDVPAAGGELRALTSFSEPVTGEHLPVGEGVLVQIDEGGNERTQLHLLEPGGEPRPLVHDPEFIHSPGGFTRDGLLLAFASNRRNGVDFDVWVAPVARPEEAQLVFAPGLYCEAAGFSPDGRLLAVQRVGERSGDDELYLVTVETGEAVEVAPHRVPAGFGEPQWLPDGESFLVASSVDRETAALGRYELAAGRLEPVLEAEWELDCRIDLSGRRLVVVANEDGWSRLELRDPRTLALVREVPLPGRGVVEGCCFSPDGRLLAYGFSSSTRPSEAWLFDVESGETARLTESPCEPDPAGFVEPELARVPSFDRELVPVFVFRPPERERAPVVVEIHGGPEGQWRPGFKPLVQYLVARGYAVAAPNVRGSTGYGKRYEHLDDVELRLDSVRDLAALHSALDGLGLDAGRVALHGGSYGGYMVLAGLAFHPELWTAGVEEVGISSLVTFLENTSDWRRYYREREYGRLDRDRELLERLSPLGRADSIRAPLFVIHGANDPRVPVTEAEQIHRVLTEQGVRCELLVFGDEGHGLGKLPNRLAAYERAMAFLDEVVATP